MMDITAIGLSTAFGTGVAAIQTALADDREAMMLRSDMIGTDFRPLLCVFAQDSPLAGVAERVIALIADALRDLSGHLAARKIGWPKDAALVLLTPGADIGFPEKASAELATLALSRLREAGWLAHDGQVRLVQGGAGTTAAALRAVAEFTAAGTPVFLVAADSHACRHRLGALLEENALFSNASKWGFIPGEAACAVLIEPARADRGCVARITGIAEATEPVPERAQKDSAHTGLSDAALGALQAHGRSGFALPGQVLTDWNNSRYRAAEFSYALVRLTGLLRPGFVEAEHPAMRFGQCGAAWFAAVMAWLATDGAGACLVLCGNETDGTRGAFVLCLPEANAAPVET